MVTLDEAQVDRAVGVVLGMAAGDALGAGYEFGPPLPADQPVGMIGGNGHNWEPGEWTDDTSMAIPILDAVADGLDLRASETRSRIGDAWIDWARTAKDVGIQTREVLHLARSRGGGAEAMLAAAHDVHQRHGRSGGNGSLMRTAPVVLAHLDDPDGLTEAATAVSALTHFDPEAAEACVLWCHLARHAVLTGVLDRDAGLDALPVEARDRWALRLAAAERQQPRDFERNGWVVEALQAAWSAVVRAQSAEQPLRWGLEDAVRGGRDADTVAAIAGTLIGAQHGAAAIPEPWREVLHGWPGRTADDLAASARRALGC